ncbi:MAG: hypothetical protein WA437_11650 [Candidatus Sulfotelmatobacter sp.]
MKVCCVKTLNDMQEVIRNGKILALMLNAAPWVILAPEFPTDARAVTELLLRLSVDDAIDKLVDGLPDAQKAAAAVTPIVKEKLRNLTQPEWMFNHPGGSENKFWTKMYRLYGG